MFSPLAFCSTGQHNEHRITQAMMKFMKRYHVHGAALIVYSHGKTNTYLFGEAVPAKHIPVTENTIFELGSITKTFTGALLASNVMLGKTSLSESIQPYLDKPHSSMMGKLTYLNLATHSSGLPFNARNLPYNASFSSTHRFRFYHALKSPMASYRMNSQMLYSNFGFGILGRVLANKAQTTLPKLMSRTLLTPLNMNMSGLDISPEKQKYLAQGYTAQGKPAPYHSSGLLGGAWAMRSSVKDMRYYLRAALGDPRTPKSIYQAIRLSQVPYYDVPRERMQMGLGWVIAPLNQKNSIQRLIRKPEHYHFIPIRGLKIKNPHFNPHALIGKTGATDGFRAYIAMIPEKNTGVVIMTNQFLHSGFSMSSMANQILLEASA
jgi:beta-lactamase class C